MREKFIVGNWKMYTTAAVAGRLAKAIVDGMGTKDRVSVGVCPPFPYLALVGEILKGSRVALGAQNLYPEKEGAFTGEVSPTMLLDLGCKYVILGHSERRHTLGESDTFINQKVRVALAAGLDVIFCCGETLDEREAGQTEAVLDRQLVQGLADLSPDTLTAPLRRVRAGLGNRQSRTRSHPRAGSGGARCHSASLRSDVRREGRLRRLVIQYGGSVKPENAAALLSRPGVDGALIGGASLHAEQFLAIVRAGIREPQTDGKR